MKILAASKAIINLAIGAQNAVLCCASNSDMHDNGAENCLGSDFSCEKCKIDSYFPNFEFQDRAGSPHLFESHEAPYRLIIESYSLSSQYERLASCRVSDPLFALALNGDGFHGQYNRPWLAGKGNLHLCARIPTDGACISPLFQIIPSLAVVRSIEGDFRFKWPNDIVTLNPLRKIGGALSSYLSGDGALLFGIGVNLCHAPKITMLSDIGAAACFQHAFDINAQSRIHHQVANDVMRHLVAVNGELLSSPKKLLDEYRDRLVGLGQHITLVDAMTQKIVASGVFSDIDADFAICLQGHTTHYRHVRIHFAEGDDSHTRYAMTSK